MSAWSRIRKDPLALLAGAIAGFVLSEHGPAVAVWIKRVVNIATATFQV